jgi:metallophosphoesterase superfamily enzyme
MAQTETRVAAISDYGVAISDSHKAAIATLITNWAPDAVITAGDNYHDRTPTCSSYAECVSGYNSYTSGYTDFVTRGDFFPSYGNHDAMHSSAYTSYFSYLPSSPDANHLYYDVVVGDIHFGY